MAQSTVALCSRALVTLGARPIASLEETGTEAMVCRRLYPSIRDALLSAHPWTFATGQARLARLSAAPLADYRHAYQLPADFLRALSAGDGGRGRGLSYRLAESRLHCDADEVVLTYVFRPHESNFPPFFDDLLAARLAAEFCLPITESTSRAEALTRLANDAFRRARQIDSQQDTPPRFQDFPLVEVRGG
jgi:hypothetical protein